MKWCLIKTFIYTTVQQRKAAYTGKFLLCSDAFAKLEISMPLGCRCAYRCANIAVHVQMYGLQCRSHLDYSGYIQAGISVQESICHSYIGSLLLPNHAALHGIFQSSGARVGKKRSLTSFSGFGSWRETFQQLYKHVIHIPFLYFSWSRIWSQVD